MELTAVRCNHCGAPLEVGDRTRFVTCKFCSSQLEVKHTGSTAFTEVVYEIADNTRQMASNLKVIELQNDLERLDRDWENNKMQYYVRGKDGSMSRPNRLVGTIVLFLMGAFGVFFAASSAEAGASGIFPLFGIGFVVIAVISAVSMFTKAGGLEEAESSYQQQRASMQRQIDVARQER